MQHITLLGNQLLLFRRSWGHRGAVVVRQSAVSRLFAVLRRAPRRSVKYDLNINPPIESEPPPSLSSVGPPPARPTSPRDKSDFGSTLRLHLTLPPPLPQAPTVTRPWHIFARFCQSAVYWGYAF